MTRYVAIFAVAWTLVGCRAPAPSFDLLAPYGSPTVPPPRTGSIGTAGTYYAPTTPGTQSPATAPTAPTTTTPAVMPPSQPVAPPVSYMGTSNETLSGGTTSVAQASYQPGSTRQVDAPATTVTDEVLPSHSTTQSGSPATASSSTLRLNGMRVNDATQYAEPQQFNPAREPINIANLPSANASTPSFLRFINPKSGTSSGTVTPNPPATSSGAWQTR
jgi:hypothetical protein